MCLTTLGQKVRLEGDDSRFLCHSDSITHFAVKELIDNKVDSIMTFIYDYDNGRVERAVTYIIWIDKGQGFVRQFGGCEQIKNDSTYNLYVSDLFDYYRQKRIDTITGQIEAEMWQSHDMGYYVTVYLPGQTKSYNIRDYERGKGYNIDGKRMDGQEPKYPSDPRVIWINKFEEKIN